MQESGRRRACQGRQQQGGEGLTQPRQNGGAPRGLGAAHLALRWGPSRMRAVPMQEAARHPQHGWCDASLVNETEQGSHPRPPVQRVQTRVRRVRRVHSASGPAQGCDASLVNDMEKVTLATRLRHPRTTNSTPQPTPNVPEFPRRSQPAPLG